jgi:PAS domain S-box-containing protein
MDYRKSKKELIAELKRIREKANQDEEIFNIMYNSLNDALFISELGDDGTLGKFIHVNDTACRRLGYTREELLSKTPADINSDRMRPFLGSSIKEILRNKSLVFETEHVTHDGSILQVELSTTLTSIRGKILLNTIARDIADRKQSEKMLKNVEQRFFSLFENSLDAILLTSPDGTIQAVNPAACLMFGRTQEEILGLGRDGIVDLNDPRLKKLLEKRAKTGLASGELNCIRKDGSIFPAEISSSVYTDTNGIPRSSMIIRDITKRKEAEEKLRLSEEKFNKAFNNSPDAIVITRAADGMIIEVNEALLKLSGYLPDEVNGLTTMAIRLWSVKSERDRYILLLKANGTVRDFETKLRTKSGSLRDVVISAELFTVNGERLIIGIIRDVTESRATQTALRESEERLRLSTELANVAVWEYDFKTNSMSRSQNHDRLYGLARQDDWNFDTFLTAIHPDDRENSNNTILDSVSPGGSDRYSFDFRVIHPDMTIHWLNVIGEVIVRDDKGAGIIVRGCLIDVTERKNAEEQVRKKDVEFRQLSMHLPDLIYKFVRRPDGQYCVPIASEGIRNIFGCSPDEVVDNFSQIYKVIHPDDQERIIHGIEESAASLSLFTTEFRVVVPGREQQWILSRSTPEKLADGAVAWYGFCTDITFKKNVEQQIRQSEEKWRTLFEILPVGVAMVDSKDRILEFNRELQAILGFSEDNPDLSLAHDLKYSGKNAGKANSGLSALDIINPDNKPVYDIEMEVDRPDGRKKWLLLSAAPLSLPGTRRAVVMTDITEKKNKEQEISEMRDSLENLNRHLVNIREEERASISRDIHDQLGQSLTALKLDIDWLTKRINKDTEESAKLATMTELASGMISDIQRISSDLRPSILDDFGLAAAIEWYCEEYSGRTGIKMDIDVVDIQLDDMLSNLTLYRVFQESLTNVIRHANAKNVFIKLAMKDSDIELIISDDGIGISSGKATSPKSLGILGMRERVRYAGGSLDITSPPEGGTTVNVRIPSN